MHFSFTDPDPVEKLLGLLRGPSELIYMEVQYESGWRLAILIINGARGNVVDSGTVLQAEMSRFRFPMSHTLMGLRGLLQG
jgi:hypothetical protein